MEKQRIDYLPLTFLDGTHLRIRNERFLQTREELEHFLDGKRHLHTKSFAKDVMFSHEIKANNQIEGYHDDVLLVRETIARRYPNKESEQAKRILNLYHGYNYILREPNINPETLKKLYSILSKKLLEENDIARMGEYYRQDKNFIYPRGILSAYPDEGVPVEKIDEFMNAYFEFLNNLDYSKNITDEYIKSQILHFYFVYIHPYFDVNGRTSRTLAMWYLLNQKAYPYIIFNRGITFKGCEYDKAIIDVKKYQDISFFIDYMLKTVQIELEKEYIMQSIASSTNKKLTATDWQTLLYILSMNGNLSVLDFVATYNRFNDKKTCKEIYETMIDPLISNGILEITRISNKIMFDNLPNEMFEINESLMEYDRDDIVRLVRYKNN